MRSLPDGADANAAAEFCAETLATDCCTCGAAFSAARWVIRLKGKIPGTKQTAKKKPALFVSGELMGSSHPAAGVNASSLLPDACRSSKSWMAGCLPERLIP